MESKVSQPLGALGAVLEEQLLLLLLMDMISEKVVLYTEMVIALDSVKLV